MRILMRIKLHFKCQANLLKVFGKIISGAGFQKSAPAASLLRCASQCVKVESCFLFNNIFFDWLIYVFFAPKPTNNQLVGLFL